MSQNKSDYTLPRTNVHAMLPTIIQNPLLNAMCESTYNRFLTKPELTRVIGTIGTVGNKSKNDQIVEPTVFDQAFQLQPAIISSLGPNSTDVITYTDIIRMGERVGIDFSKVDLWQSTEQFNYSPPINLDKLLNYGDYFWVDNNVVPQYIVIGSKHIKLQSELSQMVRVFLGTPDAITKSSLCPDIYRTMFIVNAVVSPANKLAIPSLNLLLEDPIYASYVPPAPIVFDPKDYALTSDWSKVNKWVHRLDLDDVSSATVAALPIIEYNDTLPETQWSFTRQVWQYRKSPGSPWNATDTGPSRDELFGNPPVTSKNDEWLGFDQHWLYVKAEPPVPVVAQTQWKLTPDTTIVAPGNVTEFVLTAPIALGKNILRVYVDGIRQYGSYAEVHQFHIKFFVAPKAGSVITVYTQVASASDLGKESVLVNGKMVSLVEYRLEEQHKTQNNDYPTFDLVDKDGNPLYESSSIFAFTESPSYPVHAIMGKRIVYDAATRDYGFTTGLVTNDKQFKYYIDARIGLSSIWAKDKSGAKYVPIKVDADRKPSTADDAVWEIPQPFTNNVAHECRNNLRFSELFIHFTTIMEAQSLSNEEMRKFGEDNQHAYRLMSTINYGAGGTIKEYNNNIANFISSLINSEYTTVDVIDFAEKEYQNKLIEARKTIETFLPAVLQSKASADQADIIGTITNLLFDSIRRDATQGKLYSDSSVSLVSTLQNWCATLPYLHLSQAVQPEILRDKKMGIAGIVHHDGHSFTNEFGDVTDIRAKIVATATKVSVDPTIAATVGDMVYNVVTETLFRYTPTGWMVFEVTDVVLSVLLRLEQALYATAPTGSLPYDVNVLAAARPEDFNNLQRLEFENYCSTQGIVNPYKGDFDITNPFTWSFAGTKEYAELNGAVPGTNPNIVIPASKWAPRWKQLYTNIYGTAHPNLQPWKLQQFNDKPTWWDELYKDTTGARRWKPIMWTNIMSGLLPSNFGGPIVWTSVPSLAVLVTSVNITDNTVGGYGPDDLLPPYWLSVDPIINSQSLLGSGYDFMSMYISSNEYAFGDIGPKEDQWRNSISYGYSRLRTAYKLDPIRFFNKTFGESFTMVQDLEICDRTNNVLSHRDIVFHGDTDYNGVKQYFAGINQWYVQLFRQASLYGNGGIPQQIWTKWITKLSYNIGAFVVDNTMTITSPRFSITPNDYSVQMKVARKVRDLWVDALYVTVDQAGSFRELPQGAGRDWKFNVGLHSPIIRDVPFYGVKKYRVSANPATNTFTILDGMTLEEAGWDLGFAIMMDTGVNGMLPTAVDDQTYYYVIPRPVPGVEGTTTFSIATFIEDAYANKPLELLSNGSGVMYVAELVSTFHAFESQHTATLWKHFAIDKRDVRTFSSSMSITGIQNIVDMVDGYVSYLTDAGFVFNDSSVPEYDENDRLVNWQYEVESMINYLYLQIGTISTFTQNGIPFQVGEIELNPFRNNLWIDHPTGVVSEFNNNRHASSQAFVYDRDGNKVSTKEYHILRQDQRTQFSTLMKEDENIQSNAVSYIYEGTSIAGVRMFFDEYEHVILFNQRTMSQSFIYDGFLGISIPRVQAYFEKQSTVTKRPNVGGFVLQDGGLYQNYEYTVGNIQQYYDTFTVNENSNFVDHARSLLGYKADAKYFVGSDTTPKSQFLFYKGMIKAKGTQASMAAYANSNQSATAEVDEFWAYKTLEFGDNRTNVSYRVNLMVDDTAGSHIKFQFVQTPAAEAAKEFTKVAIADASRWSDFPSQLVDLANMDKAFSMKPTSVFSVSTGLYASVVPGLTYSNFVVSNGSSSVNGVERTRLLLIHDDATAVTLQVSDKRINDPAWPPRKTITTNGVTSLELGFNYVPGSGNIVVYVNGQITTAYQESSPTGITFDIATSGVIVVVKKVGTLIDGVHYTRLNSRTIQLLKGDPETVQVIQYEANYADSMPVKIYDQKSKVVVSDIPAWDPKKGYDIPMLAKAVDISSMNDPAKYNSTPDMVSLDVRLCWGPAEVGTIWKDTRSFGYVPYADMTRAVSSRLSNWGNVAEWSDPAVYQWVSSKFAPSNWSETDGAPRKEVYTRSRVVTSASGIIVGTGNVLLNGAHNISVGDEVILLGDGIPEPLISSTIYVASGVTGSQITLSYRDGSPITFDSDLGLDFRMTKASYANTWTKVLQEIEYREMLEVNFGTAMLRTAIADHNEVTLYANGMYLQDGFVSGGMIELEPEVFAPYRAQSELYQITIVTKTGVVDGLPSTRPANIDLADTSSQMYTEFPFTRMEHLSEVGTAPQPLYYFWARNISNVETGVSLPALEYMIAHNDSAYAMCMNPKVIDGSKYLDQLAIAGTSGMVTDSDRYILRLIKNDTLRDTLPSASTLNKVHTQWAMFRQNQANNVERSLWDKITESIIGHVIGDPTTAIPSWDRIIYDSQHSANTRFGLGKDQAFVDGEQALATILSMINSNTIDYTPIDVDAFLDRFNFDTSDNIVACMNAIYLTFSAKHVNNIFFTVMHDALSNHRVDYSKSLMKTSMISLTGTIKLNVNGVYDE